MRALLILATTVINSFPDASIAAQVTAPALSTQAQNVVPIADHHVHLYSPADVALNSPAPLPEITLPRELADVLRKRNESATDEQSLRELYTRDALYYRGGLRGWAQGSEAAAGWVKWGISDFPYRVAPVAYNRDANSARIAGYYLEGKNFEERFGTSLLSLVKEKDGKWRIAEETYVFEQPQAEKPKTAADAIAQLDAVGSRLGAVVSNSYYFDSVRPEPVRNPYPYVKAENDWTAAQVAQFPGRLIAFCSFSAVADYALTELDRCASSGKFRGIKLHFNAAQLNLKDPAQVSKVRAVMAAANERRLPLIIHARTGNKYGRDDAEILLNELIAAAPDVSVQIAHLWGGEDFSAPALKVFADAFTARHRATKNLYLDMAAVLMGPRRPEQMIEIVERMRQIGLKRILYGSDAPPIEAWAGFRKNVPLTEKEFQTIASNVAPYFQTQ